MIREAVLLAAGAGTRLRARPEDPPKPLTTVGGRTLLEHAVSGLRSVGIKEIVVVVGFRAEDVRMASRSRGVRFALNPDWERSFGASVLAARGHVRGPCVLTMADHLCAPALYAAAASVSLAGADIVLCVDRRITENFDLDDCTKVATAGGQITAIGKKLVTYDALDTGVFAVAPSFFAILEDVLAERPEATLSDAVARSAAAGRARILDVGDLFWHDVDTPEALIWAEDYLSKRSEAGIKGP